MTHLLGERIGERIPGAVKSAFVATIIWGVILAYQLDALADEGGFEAVESKLQPLNDIAQSGNATAEQKQAIVDLGARKDAIMDAARAKVSWATPAGWATVFFPTLFVSYLFRSPR